MARGEEVHTSFPDRFTSGTSDQGMPVRGGRNRIRGGVGNTGDHHDMGPKGGGKSNGDAMAGTYNPDKLDSVGGIVEQNEMREAGRKPPLSGGPFEPTMMTQREIQGESVGNHVKPKTSGNTPDGAALQRPGDESQRSAYISGN